MHDLPGAPNRRTGGSQAFIVSLRLIDGGGRIDCVHMFTHSWVQTKLLRITRSGSSMRVVEQMPLGRDTYKRIHELFFELFKTLVPDFFPHSVVALLSPRKVKPARCTSHAGGSQVFNVSPKVMEGGGRIDCVHTLKHHQVPPRVPSPQRERELY